MKEYRGIMRNHRTWREEGETRLYNNTELCAKHGSQGRKVLVVVLKKLPTSSIPLVWIGDV